MIPSQEAWPVTGRQVLTKVFSALCPCSAVGLTLRSKHLPQTAQMAKRTKFPRSKNVIVGLGEGLRGE